MLAWHCFRLTKPWNVLRAFWCKEDVMTFYYHDGHKVNEITFKPEGIGCSTRFLGIKCLVASWTTCNRFKFISKWMRFSSSKVHMHYLLNQACFNRATNKNKRIFERSTITLKMLKKMKNVEHCRSSTKQICKRRIWCTFLQKVFL